MKYVTVTPRVYTVTMKMIPVSANICIRKQKRELSYPVSNRPRVKVNFGSEGDGSSCHHSFVSSPVKFS